MLIDRFITAIARKKNADYLQFDPSTSLTVPPADRKGATLAYVHIPFCEELCPYCSFHRVVFKEAPAREYFEALRREIRMYGDLGYEFGAVYVGGGTPTVLVDELARTIGLLQELFPVREISVETNPNHLTHGNLEVLSRAGVNRLSVGVQTFDDNLLKAIGRFHKYGSGEEIRERLARTQGLFDTLNVDMIFNFPAQTMEILDADLSALVALGVDQLTYYPLMASEYAREAMKRNIGVVDYGRERTFYKRICARLAGKYQFSTAWCFSRSASLIDEYVVNFEEYAGLGSGSIGYLGGSAYANTFDIADYVARVNRGLFPLTGRRACSLKERLRYDFLMKLFGLSLDLDHLESKHGVKTSRHLWQEILFFTLAGGLEKRGRTLYLTDEGRYYWVVMMREFFIAVNNFRDYCRSRIS